MMSETTPILRLPLDLGPRRDQFQRIASKVLGWRVEILFSAELALECHGDLGGMTGPGLHGLVREARPDLHRGNVSTVIINGDPQADGGVDPIKAAMSFDGIALHELAHLVESPPLVDRPEMTVGREARELAATHWRAWPAHSGGFPWAGHNATFIRRLLHVRHRLLNRGNFVCLEAAFNSKAYGLSSIKSYQNALGGEPSRSDWRRLADVLAEPAPEEFKQLWSSDVIRSLAKPAL